MYSNNQARAGLVALIFVLFIALGAAAPVPTFSLQPELLSIVSRREVHVGHTISTSLMQPDSGVLSTTSANTGARTQTASNAPPKSSDKLVRRSRISDKIRNAFRRVAHVISHVAQKAVSAVKSVAKKVGTFVNDNKAIIGKFGLKILATAEKIGSKVVSYIPIVGKPLSKGMAMASKGLEMASEKIHTKLPGKLGKGMDVMDKVDKYSGFLGRREVLKESAFQ